MSTTATTTKTRFRNIVQPQIRVASFKEHTYRLRTTNMCKNEQTICKMCGVVYPNVQLCAAGMKGMICVYNGLVDEGPTHGGDTRVYVNAATDPPTVITLPTFETTDGFIVTIMDFSAHSKRSAYKRGNSFIGECSAPLVKNVYTGTDILKGVSVMPIFGLMPTSTITTESCTGCGEAGAQDRNK